MGTLTPTKLADQQLDQSANNQSSKTCFGCGKLGHRKADCPHLKSGFITAAVRTKDSNELKPEPTPQQVTEEGEGESQNAKTQGITEVLQDDWEPEPSQYYKIGRAHV